VFFAYYFVHKRVWFVEKTGAALQISVSLRSATAMEPAALFGQDF
jgi:hypothetical protein